MGWAVEREEREPEPLERELPESAYEQCEHCRRMVPEEELRQDPQEKRWACWRCFEDICAWLDSQDGTPETPQSWGGEGER